MDILHDRVTYPATSDLCQEYKREILALLLTPAAETR